MEAVYGRDDIEGVLQIPIVVWGEVTSLETNGLKAFLLS